MCILVQTSLNLYKDYQTIPYMMMVERIHRKHTVQAVANVLGIYRGTVINYEKRGIFPEPRRNHINGYREYTDEDIAKLRQILEGDTSEN